MSNYPVCEDAGNFAAVAIKSVGTDLTPLQEFNVDTQLFDAL